MAARTTLVVSQWSGEQAGFKGNLDDLFGSSVKSRTLTTPPSTPGDGDTYIPAATATGAWATHEDELARWIAGAWVFVPLREGYSFWIDDEDVRVEYTGAAFVPVDQIESKSLRIVNPTSTEDVTIFHADKGYTITKMVASIVGSLTPSVTWTIRKGPDRSAAGTQVVTGGTVTTSLTTGSVVVSFDSAGIAAGDFVWLETTARADNVFELAVTVHMKRTGA
jgi:hypothetical protein